MHKIDIEEALDVIKCEGFLQVDNQLKREEWKPVKMAFNWLRGKAGEQKHPSKHTK